MNDQKAMRLKGYTGIGLVCLLYWFLDSIWSYLSFEYNLKEMIFTEPASYLDTILLRVPPYQIVSRIMVVGLFAILGIVVVEFIIKRQRAEKERKQAQETFIAQLKDLQEKRLAAEARLRQAQKMESIGTLAGGIAHDFNNILSPIIGMSELLMDDLSEGSLKYKNARAILQAGIRGRELVKQILAFSRKSEQDKIPIRIQQTLKEVIELIRSTIPSNIDIIQDIQTDCGLVMIDPTQLHQVVMNLITNAFHAVEETGGTISIKLKENDLKTIEMTGELLKPGKYAVLEIADNGCGIYPGAMDHIFDPYFTTKAHGKGTGLGLAVVHGIIKKHDGDIKVASTVKKGTTFTIYLPLINLSR